MIRRSTVIATAAILISLLVHVIGLNFSPRIQLQQAQEEAATDVVTLGNAFEDIAKKLPEPAEPENTPTPEPEPAKVPEPEAADPSSTEVLVASPDPQHTYSPDTGSVRVGKPETTGPSELDEGRVPEPEIVEPSGGSEATTVNAPIAPSVKPELVAAAPKGDPKASTKPVEPASAVSDARPPIVPALQPDVSQRLAALPAPITSALPVAPIPVPTVTPAIPLEQETLEPLSEDPDTLNGPDESGGSDLAVTTSLRPLLSPSERPTEPQGQRDGATDFSGLQSPPLVESPLTAYQNDRADPNVRQKSRAQSGGLGFLDSRGPGNSDVTNYAGRVLVHLNRAPSVHVSAQGSARVFFEIKPDGTLGRIDIIDSTGSQEVSRAAKAQIRAAEPFPRPPKGIIRRLSFTYWGN